MAKMSTVPGALVPYEAGWVIATPLDANHREMWDRSVSTQDNYLQSTQLTESVTTEELENGNGQNKVMVTSKTQTLTVTSNVYNKVFHNMVAGNLETLPAKANMLDVFTWNLPATAPESGLKITFGASGDHKREPAPNADGEYFFIINDSYMNNLVRRDTPELGAYSWDEDTKTLSFSNDYAGAEIRVTYEYESENIIHYESNPILSQKEFRIDVFGTTVDPNTDRKVKKHECIKRATLSGDVPGMPTQKSRAASMVYTFSSAPVPAGVSPYFCDMEPLDDDGGSGTGADNIVNGGDDNFTSKP